MLRIVHDFTDHALAPHVHPRGTESRAAHFFHRKLHMPERWRYCAKKKKTKNVWIYFYVKKDSVWIFMDFSWIVVGLVHGFSLSYPPFLRLYNIHQATAMACRICRGHLLPSPQSLTYEGLIETWKNGLSS